LWIDRSATWPTLVVPIQLADHEGRTPRTTGAFLATGASIEVAFGSDRMRHVTLRDPDVAVDGWVPASAIGNVWIGDDATHMQFYSVSGFEPRSDGRPITKLTPRAIVRAAPDATASIVAIIVGDPRAFVISRGPWSEVELVRDHARIRGFVREAELRPDDDQLGSFGTGGGTGFGMSHTDRLAVAAGTCLYDKIGGDVIGVTIKDLERLGERETDQAGWSRVYVDSPWAVLGYFVHDTGSDPKQPVWESCAKRH
jgi:hypothetical protein